MKYATTPAPREDRREMMLGEPSSPPKGRNPIDEANAPRIRPLTARYATPPPRVDFCWLETAHFMPTDGETVLMAWPRKTGFTFRTGRFHAGKWRLSCDTEPRQKPVFFSTLKT